MRTLERALTILVLVPLLIGRAASADAASSSSETPPPAMVRFFNRDIATLSGYYLGHPPAQRAAIAAQRIQDIVARDGPGAVEATRTTDAVIFTVDGAYVFRLLQADLDSEDGTTYDQAQRVVAQRLREAIAAARSSRGPDVVRGVVLALVTTLGFGVAVVLLARARGWLGRRLTARIRLRLGAGEQLTIVVRFIEAAGHLLFFAVFAILAEEWLRLLFGFFPYTRPWSEQLTGYVVAIVADVARAVVDAAPGLVMVGVIAGLAYLSTRVLSALALGAKAGRYRLPGIDAHSVPLARRLASAVIWLFALAMAYPYLPGSSSEAFKGVSVLVGLMLSLGASSVVTQAAGGLILTFGHVVRPGEWVRVGDIEGAVIAVGMFSTTLRTPLDEEVNIPNSVLLTSVSRNFSRPDAAGGSILETSVTIGYSAPWRQVHAMLLDAAARTPELEREPPPYVLQTALSDFYVQYSLRVRVKDQRRRPDVLSALNANVQDVFNEYGVQIMSPHYVLDPAAPVLVPKTRWYDAPASSGKPGRNEGKA